MKNAICAWGTIVMMGLGTAGAATYAARVEDGACDQRQQSSGRVKRVRRAEPAPAPAPVQAPVTTVDGREAVSQPKAKAVRPAPRPPIDTRLLSRVSRRQV